MVAKEDKRLSEEMFCKEHPTNPDETQISEYHDSEVAEIMIPEFRAKMPSYYSIIPANVRYSKDLSAQEKLFYSEITALTNLKG